MIIQRYLNATCFIIFATCLSCIQTNVCDIHTVSYHESGHAIYSTMTGLLPSHMVVSHNDAIINCPGKPLSDERYCGLTCHDSWYSSGIQGQWDRCALSEAGRLGNLVGLDYNEGAKCHKTDDENAANMAAIILEERDNGKQWRPNWENDLTEDASISDIIVECDRHARKVLEDNKELLINLATVLENDEDGVINSEDILNALVVFWHSDNN